jgi:electron transfer flavoprotein beta subunit
MAAKRASIPHWGPQDIEASEEKLGLRGSPTQVKKVFAPQARGERRMLEGSPEQQVEALIQALKEMKCL